MSLSCLFDARFVGHRVPIHAEKEGTIFSVCFLQNKQTKKRQTNFSLLRWTTFELLCSCYSENCRRGNAGAVVDESFPHRCAITGKAACMFGRVAILTFIHCPWRVGHTSVWVVYKWPPPPPPPPTKPNGSPFVYRHCREFARRYSTQPESCEAPSYISTHMLCVHHKSSTCVEEKIHLKQYCWFETFDCGAGISLLFVFCFFLTLRFERKKGKKKNGASRRCVCEWVCRAAGQP